MSRLTVERYHDFSMGHRLVGYNGNCAQIHGHNVRVTFTVAVATDADAAEVAAAADDVGFVLDFRTIKERLCNWLEDNWDHKTLLWVEDPMWEALSELYDLSGHALTVAEQGAMQTLFASIALVPFNPSSESIADYLLRVVGPKQLEGTGTKLVRVRFEETRKCTIVAEIPY
jgi:6-pyruvoyltetrahydropterin/6-carboxytetrahydropterin synthase